MKSLALITAVAVLVTGSARAAIAPATLVQIDSKDFGDTNSLIKIVELERNTNTSKLRMTSQKMGSSVGSSMLIMRGFFQVAKSRGADYFVNLKEWDDQEGGRIHIAGFTNTKDADLKKEFGEEYSYKNESGQERVLMSVSQLERIFEGPEGTPAPGGPANRTQPVRSETNHPQSAAGSRR